MAALAAACAMSVAPANPTEVSSAPVAGSLTTIDPALVCCHSPVKTRLFQIDSWTIGPEVARAAGIASAIDFPRRNGRKASLVAMFDQLQRFITPSPKDLD